MDFMFELTKMEYDSLRSHFGTLKVDQNSRSQFGTSGWGGRRYLPMLFTEHRVLMLSSVLGSKRAVEVNIQIKRIFTRIRQTLADNTDLQLAIEEIKRKTENNTKNIELVFKYLDELHEKKEIVEPRKQIGYWVK